MWASRLVVIAAVVAAAATAATATGHRCWSPHCSSSYEEFSADG